MDSGEPKERQAGDTDGGNDGKRVSKGSGGFQRMGLSLPVLKAVLRKGFRVPTPIQRKCIPLILSGVDVVGMARTGSGKTAAFLIPLVENLSKKSSGRGGPSSVRAILISPTRELAEQTFKVLKELAQFVELRSALVIGGEKLEDQFSALSRCPDILVGTPGRLLHIIEEVRLSLVNVDVIVHDEADRLFELGFAPQLIALQEKLPEVHQTLLFSATLPPGVSEFARAGLRDPELVRLDTETRVSPDLEYSFFVCRSEEKLAILLLLLRSVVRPNSQTLVFVASRHHVDFVHGILSNAGMKVGMAHGQMDQSARKYHVNRFRHGHLPLLVVTDVAARGIDLPFLDYVINFHFPGTPKLFVHRVGRVARMGRPGCALSLVDGSELPHMVDLHLFLGHSLKKSGFEGEAGAVGSVPQPLVDRYSEEVERIVENNSALSALVRVTSNAMKLYTKTRPSASPESVRRAKSLPIRPHWRLVEFADDSEKGKSEFLEQVHNFRSKATIFELKGAQGGGAGVMAERRKRFRPTGEAVGSEKETGSGAVTGRLPHVGSQTRDAGEKHSARMGEEDFYLANAPTDVDAHIKRAYAVNDTSAWKDLQFEITPEDHSGLQKERARKKWDKKKGKYVNAPAAPTKNEAGVRIRDAADGKKFIEWKRKRGEGDLASGAGDERPSSKRRRVDTGARSASSRSTRVVRSELKGPEQIRKLAREQARQAIRPKNSRGKGEKGSKGRSSSRRKR